MLRFLEERLGHRCDAGASAPAAEPFVLLVQEAHRVSGSLPPVPEGVALPSRIEDPPAGGTRIDIVETARRCDLSLFYVPSMRNGTEDAGEVPEDRGNAILASVPLSDFTAIELPLETQRRVAVTALAHPPGRPPVRVASFHLDVAASLMRVLTTGNGTRYLQGMGLVRGLEALETRDGIVPAATVIGGDVNTWSEKETVIRHLVERFPESPLPTDEGTRGPFPTDHLFVRAAPGSGVSVTEASYRVIPEDYSSDHRARVLELRFGTATEPARAE
jgi:endonuclease/exonuclease/phosphatase family metal-dependent hydrolase